MEKEKEKEITYNYCFEDRFLEEDLNIRHIFLNGEIEQNSISSVAYYILRYNMQDKNIPLSERKPIILYINSVGGSLVDGYGIIDAILMSETPVYTVNLAQCASMAFLVFIAGHKRYAMPHSEFMMHDGFTGGFDSVSKLKDRIEFETVQLSDMIKKYVMEMTKINEDLYNRKYRVEWYFMADEAKRIGAVDYIVGTDCKLSEII